MRDVLLVARQEMRANLRRKSFLLMTFLVPALGVVAFVVLGFFSGEVGGLVSAQFEPQRQAIGYVDRSGLLDELLPVYRERFQPFPDEAAATAALLDERIASFFVLPEDYVDSGRVWAYGTGGGFSNFVSSEDNRVSDLLVDHLLAGKVDAAVRQRVVDPADVTPVTLDASGEVSTESPFSWVGDFVVPYVFAILFVITLFTTSGFLLQGVSEEKEGRIIEILLSSTTATRLLAGKILGLGAVGLVQVAVWFGAGAGLLALAVSVLDMAGLVTIRPATVALSLLYAGLGYLLFATLMAVAGSMGTSQRESQQIASLFSFSAAIPWFVFGVVVANPNAPIAVALSYFPLTAPVMMLIRLGFGTVPPEQVTLSLAILVGSIAASLWAGAKVFRVGLLMYGQRPGVRDLARGLRQA